MAERTDGMYWMFILNDLLIDSVVLPAEEIAEYLLEKEVWQYTPLTPNIKKINKGAKVLVYLAGPKRKYFYATFELQEQIKSTNMELKKSKDWKESFNQMFKLDSSICKVEKFTPPINLDAELRGRLSFIVDKKNWGLYFRQGVRTLSEQDYKAVMDCIR